MSVIDIEQIRKSTSGDEEIMLDLIKIGQERMSVAEKEIKESLTNEDWDALARIVHKLRPVLHFVGLVTLEDDLVLIEKNAKERTNLSQLTDKFAGIFSIFEEAQTELAKIKNSLEG